MRQHINELVVIDGEQIICVPPQQDIQLAASLGSENSPALSMFQALTGCDTASVLNLLKMDRKLHGMPAMELIARACYLHVHSLTSKNISVLHSCMCRGFHQHTLLWNSMSRVHIVFQSDHVWGQIRVSQPVLPSLVHGTRLIMDYMYHTGPHFQDLLQVVTCGMPERML